MCTCGYGYVRVLACVWVSGVGITTKGAAYITFKP